ncbi:hypothetical protein [Achromobacter denitrificans]|uniref:Uncharacterized protein n=1 Tax=Achromobacter denitrificans TaxID=32002 RepID=A0ABZ3GAS5_ACHDE
MSKINDGGPAFALQDPQAIHAKAAAAIEGVTDSDERDRLYTQARAAAVGGMTLRDYFAAKAMQGEVAACHSQRAKPDEVATFAYAVADAMLAARGAQ